jgi:hypothetical protein
MHPVDPNPNSPRTNEFQCIIYDDSKDEDWHYHPQRLQGLACYDAKGPGVCRQQRGQDVRSLVPLRHRYARQGPTL